MGLQAGTVDIPAFVGGKLGLCRILLPARVGLAASQKISLVGLTETADPPPVLSDLLAGRRHLHRLPGGLPSNYGARRARPSTTPPMATLAYKLPSPVYTAPVNVSSSENDPRHGRLQAARSVLSPRGAYTITQVVATPTLAPGESALTPLRKMVHALSDATAGATIYYTTGWQLAPSPASANLRFTRSP